MTDKPKYSLINNETGEISELDVFYDPKKMKWQKVYARNLANMLEITGDEKTRVIAYLIKKKDYENRVIATMRGIASELEISPQTVNKVLKVMQKNNFIHKIQNGVWRFSPHIMVTGVGTLGAAVVQMYDTE